MLGIFLHASCLNITVINVSIGSRCLHKKCLMKTAASRYFRTITSARNHWLNLFFFLSLFLRLKCDNLPNCYDIIYLYRPKTSVINSDYVLCIWNANFFYSSLTSNPGSGWILWGVSTGYEGWYSFVSFQKGDHIVLCRQWVLKNHRLCCHWGFDAQMRASHRKHLSYWCISIVSYSK